MAVDRRKFMQRTGGLAAILASGRAPAYAQGTSLHWLRLGDFVPASDTLLRRELLPEAEKALGLKITFETINGNELQARITSGIQSGSGADLIHALHNWPHLYAESVADVSDVAEEIATLKRRIIRLELDRDSWRDRYKQEREGDAEFKRLERRWDRLLGAAAGTSKGAVRMAATDRRRILNCLHPDRRASVTEQELTEAFQIFQELLAIDDKRACKPTRK